MGLWLPRKKLIGAPSIVVVAPLELFWFSCMDLSFAGLSFEGVRWAWDLGVGFRV